MSNRFENKDPHFERELEKYGRPIPSREYIQSILAARKRPMSEESLIEHLGVQDPELQIALTRRLNAMVREGEICQKPEGFLPESFVKEIQGQLTLVDREIAVLDPETGEPVYILNVNGDGLWAGDEVLIKVSRYSEDRMFGVFIRCVEYVPLQILGRMTVGEGLGHVVSYDKEMPGEIQLTRGGKRAKDGQIVLVEIDRSESQIEAHWCGEIIKILGDRGQPGIEVDMAIEMHKIPHEWPESVEKMCEKWGTTVPENAYAGRKDLRDLNLVTIDGEDAKDFDDAVYCEPRPKGGWRLIVAIADVSYYVKAHSALDKEAEYRGNSVYFPGVVIPMLPEVLSNELCSLKPAVDRLCMVCDMTISEAGHITHYEFYNAVMHSKARFTYNEVANILEGNKRLRTQFSSLVEMLENLEALYKQLNIAREERGAIAFETVETQFLFDEAGQVAKIIPRTRNEAHKIIEECMLCANVATARFLQKHKKPTLYRVHAGPNVDKLIDLRKYLGIHGVELSGGETPKPADYNAVLRHIQALPNFKVLQTMLLRSLKQAMYSPENEGHFGLSYPAYTHFTSPIRRYPDLMVHRAIKAVLKGDFEADPKGDSLEALQEMGEHCSITERIADDASREVSQALKCRFMVDKVGEIYQGCITTVVPFGLFIELKDVYVEGLVHVTQLGQDYFVYDQSRQRMVGERTRVIYQLGDTVEVKLVRVDLDANRIDLQLMDSPLVLLDTEHSDKPKKKRKKRK